PRLTASSVAASKDFSATKSLTSSTRSRSSESSTSRPMLDMSSQSRRHSLAERGLDLYETPAVAVEALLRAERLPRQIWKPACGRGAIVSVLRAHGHEVVASDIADYGLPITPPGYYGRD